MKFKEITTLRIGDTVEYSWSQQGTSYVSTVIAHVNFQGQSGYKVEGRLGRAILYPDTDLHSFRILERAP